jgi:hypothetical protein
LAEGATLQHLGQTVSSLSRAEPHDATDGENKTATREVRRMENPKTHPDQHSNAEKNPDDWVTGDEPMTGAQASYLQTLSEQAKSDPPEGELTKAEASKLIDELKERVGLG